MKNKLEGFTTGRILALLLVAAMILTLGLTAAASADDGEDEEIAVIDIAVPAEETTADFEEIAVLDEETLIKATEEAKKEAEEAKQAAEELKQEMVEPKEGDNKENEKRDDNIPWTASAENVASEYQSLSDNQLAQYREIWVRNDFVFHTMPDMMAIYAEVGGLSTEAQFAMYLANAWCCAEYTKEYYTGNERYLAAFDALCENYYELAQITDVVDSIETMYEAYAEGIQALNELKQAEDESNGVESFTEIFIAYGNTERAEADADAFFTIVVTND